MADFGQNFLKGFIGSGQGLRDYSHASRTFTTNAYELKPRFKFLFHVSFSINTGEIPYLRSVFGSSDVTELSLLVKTADLPRYNIQTSTMNQYNRKRLVQTKLEYQPINLTFHDDGGDNARRLWYYYFSYYYNDPAQQYLAPNVTNGSAGASQNRSTGFGYPRSDIYNDTLQVPTWGYSGESWTNGTSAVNGKPAFFKDIRIYGMDQRKFAEYILINPIIKSWNHDTYDYSQGNGTMQHSMTLEYETVKYYEGAMSRGGRADQNIQGFGGPEHYDTTLSPIARPGSNSTIFGQGGLLDAADGILGDLQSGTVGGLIGATQKALLTRETFKNKNLSAIAKSEATSLGINEISKSLPGAIRPILNRPTGVFIPTPQRAAPGPTTGPTPGPPP
jgi:hypothetical protein